MIIDQTSELNISAVNGKFWQEQGKNKVE